MDSAKTTTKAKPIHIQHEILRAAGSEAGLRHWSVSRDTQAIVDLEDRGLIVADGGVYRTTDRGAIKLHELDDLAEHPVPILNPRHRPRTKEGEPEAAVPERSLPEPREMSDEELTEDVQRRLRELRDLQLRGGK